MNRLKTLLYIGSAYFFLMSFAHILNIKIPVLFVYYNVPSNIYQDKLIGLLVFGWGLFYCLAAKTLDKLFVKAILISGIVAVSTLFYINFSTKHLSGFSPIIYNIHVSILLAYSIWLFIEYRLLD